MPEHLFAMRRGLFLQIGKVAHDQTGFLDDLCGAAREQSVFRKSEYERNVACGGAY
jgi:hypothetical protein